MLWMPCYMGFIRIYEGRDIYHKVGQVDSTCLTPRTWGGHFHGPCPLGAILAKHSVALGPSFTGMVHP